MKLYKIGDVSRLLGVTTQALRFYEQEGAVVPQKSENGTRYYTIEEIHKILSFKKYRMAEFTVQDFVDHLKEDSLHALSHQLDDKCDELIARSEELLRRAQALRQFRQEVDEASENIGVLSECMRPEIYLQEYALNDLDEFRSSERREVSAYIDALPATSIAFTRSVDLKTLPRFCMSVTAERAQRWGLSLKHAELLLPVRCVSTYMRFEGSYLSTQPLEYLFDELKEKGYQINKEESILSLHIASDVQDGITYICGKIFIPIL